MKKNVASQVVQCQVVNASDGSPFTGTATVSVTGDGGTRATGSVGSGLATHEGGGLHSYLPAQAETNYDLVSFQFAGTGALTSAVHFTTNFPQTVDNDAKLTTIAGYLDTEIAALTSAVAAVQADTDNIQTRIPAALVSGRIDASVGAMASGVLTATAIAADAIDAAKVSAAAVTKIVAGVMAYAIESGETFEAMIKNIAAVCTGAATAPAGDGSFSFASRAGVARVAGALAAGVRTISTRLGT